MSFDPITYSKVGEIGNKLDGLGIAKTKKVASIITTTGQYTSMLPLTNIRYPNYIQGFNTNSSNRYYRLFQPGNTDPFNGLGATGDSPTVIDLPHLGENYFSVNSTVTSNYSGYCDIYRYDRETRKIVPVMTISLTAPASNQYISTAGFIVDEEKTMVYSIQFDTVYAVPFRESENSVNGKATVYTTGHNGGISSYVTKIHSYFFHKGKFHIILNTASLGGPHWRVYNSLYDFLTDKTGNKYLMQITNVGTSSIDCIKVTSNGFGLTSLGSIVDFNNYKLTKFTNPNGYPAATVARKLGEDVYTFSIHNYQGTSIIIPTKVWEDLSMETKESIIIDMSHVTTPTNSSVSVVEEGTDRLSVIATMTNYGISSNQTTSWKEDITQIVRGL